MNIKVIDTGTLLNQPNRISTPANINDYGMEIGKTYLVYGKTNVNTGYFYQFQDGELDFIGDPDMDYMTKRFRLTSLESLLKNSYISRLDFENGKDTHELHFLGRDLDFFPNEPRLSQYYFDKVLRKDSKTDKKDEEQKENRQIRDAKLAKLDEFLLSTTSNQKLIDRVLKNAKDREKERLKEMKREEEKRVQQYKLRQNPLQAKTRGEVKNIALPSFMEPKVTVKITTQDLVNERMREIEKRDEMIREKQKEKELQTAAYIRKVRARKALEKRTEEYYDALEAGLREEDREYEETLYFYDSEADDEVNFPLVFESV